MRGQHTTSTVKCRACERWGKWGTFPARSVTVSAALAAQVFLTACGGGASVPTTTTTAVPPAAAFPPTAALPPTAMTAAPPPTVTLPPATATPTVPTPTVTQPSPTPVVSTPTLVAPTPTPTTALYSADFADWFAGEETTPIPFRARFVPATGEYRLAITDAQRYFSYYRYAPEGQGFADFQFDVDARRVAGPDNGGSYGIVFRAQRQGPNDQTNARYLLFIYTDQTFAVTLVNADGTGTAVAPRTASEAIKGGDATNHLTVICKGNTMTVAINGQTVGIYSAALATEGAVGVSVANPREPAGPVGMEAGFSNLRISIAP